MPIRDLILAVLLVCTVLVVAFVASAIGSEYYLFFPGRRSGLQEPPTSPWLVGMLVAVPIGEFFVSRRYAAIFVAVLPILAILGLPVGILFFDWTPGIAQYLLIICLGALAAFVWTHDDLNVD